MGDETQAGVSEVRAGQRIAKVMARAGVCSRRDAEAWIAEGRVAVNGEILTSPAFNVSETDNVRVDGKPLAAPERTRLFLFHKPRGLVTTARDPEGRQTVFSVLPPDLPRLVAIGRLDINTEGLLLLTNDGGLARVLELPSTGWLRRYRVRAHGIIDQAALDRLSEGVTIDGVDYLGVEAKLDREQGANAWLTLGLREGKNREIKKILEHLGLAVNRLIRVSFGPFELGDLPEAEVMEVRTRVLRDQLGVKLAKEANVDFDPPETIAIEPPPKGGSGERPRTRSGAPRDNRGPKRAMPGRPDRGARGVENRPERDEAPRRAPPAPSTPDRRRKHVSALRAEIAADATGTTRKRVERSATHDRKGRTIAVERLSRAVEEPHTPPETRPKRSGPPRTGEHGGRAFGAGARGDRPDSSDRSEGGQPPGVSGRRVRTIRNSGIGPSGQMLLGVMADRRSVASTAPRRRRTAIVGSALPERGTAPNRRANANLSGPKVRRAPKPARADRHDRTPGMADRRSVASTAPQRKVTAIAANARHERGTALSRRASASLTGRRVARELEPARASRHDWTIRKPDTGPSGQVLQGVTTIRASAASTAPRKGKAIVENAFREHTTAPVQRASASLTAPKAGRVPQPTTVERHVRTPRAAARTLTSNQDRRAQRGVTEIGRAAPAEARGGKDGPPRDRSSPNGRSRPPGKGPPKRPGAGSRRPPRKQ